MEIMLRDVNACLLIYRKGLALLRATGGRFMINQLLFADDTALVADSEKKLCRLVKECGRSSMRNKKVESGFRM